MASSFGTYTDEDHALNLFAGFAAANGWMLKYLEDVIKPNVISDYGRRLHICKFIGSSWKYFNFISTRDEGSSEAGVSINSPTILCNWSTEFDEFNDWDTQHGHTTREYGSTTAGAGCVTDLKHFGGIYRFFATDSNLTAYFSTDSPNDDWRGFTVGANLDVSYYFASGGIYSGSGDNGSSYMSNASTNTDISGSDPNSALLIPSDGCYTSAYSQSGYLKSRVVNPVVFPHYDASPDKAQCRGSLAHPLISISPDNFRGNAVLAPSQVTITKGLLNEYYPIEIEGVKFINMKGYINDQEITYGPDTYRLYRIRNGGGFAGVAFLR